MNIAVLGTGMVGRTIGGKLVDVGHTVRMGSRDAGNPAAAEWARDAGAGATHGTFAEAATFGERVVNCTAGAASLDAPATVEANALRGKVLMDVANPLDFSRGMPPTLTVANTDSLGESIQRAYPETRVVKALNPINCLVMVDPGRVPGEHDVLICGNDEAAKGDVSSLIESFGWPRQHILDLGDITAAPATEMYLMLWLRLRGRLGTGDVNIHVVGQS
ncbi:MAG: NADPH-dependent F420 reductase [Gaiellales bacterium]